MRGAARDQAANTQYTSASPAMAVSFCVHCELPDYMNEAGLNPAEYRVYRHSFNPPVKAAAAGARPARGPKLEVPDASQTAQVMNYRHCRYHAC
jgi:hypothetical protein